MRTPRERCPILIHPLAWVVEPLEPEPTLLVRPMFGGKAVYVRGRFVLFLVSKEEPWRGVLVPTEREHQPSLIQDFPALSPHEVLPKWLYLPEAAGSFERDASELVRRIRSADLRIGIEPAVRRKRTAKTTRKRVRKQD
ncbi:hypothetical protein MASR2M8_20340 [Opitutaceae bacterium]